MMKNSMKKFLISLTIALSLVISFGVVAHAQQVDAQCSASNIDSDACYEQNCTGQSQFDSQSCISYATADANAANSPECANITNDTVYNQCCGDGTGGDANGDSVGDSPMCVAYNNSSAADANSPSGGLSGNGTGNSLTGSGTGNTSAGSTNAATNQALNIHLTNPLSVSTIGDAVNLFLGVIIKIALPLIILFFIWSGLTFIFARGNPAEVAKAKQIFLYTVIGTLLILGAWVITNAIIGTINSIIS